MKRNGLHNLNYTKEPEQIQVINKVRTNSSEDKQYKTCWNDIRMLDLTKGITFVYDYTLKIIKYPN